MEPSLVRTGSCLGTYRQLPWNVPSTNRQLPGTRWGSTLAGLTRSRVSQGRVMLLPGPQVVFPRPCAQPRHLPQALRWRPQIWVRILFITDLGRRSTTLPFQNEFSGQWGIGEYVLRDRSLRRGGETRRADLICARTLNRSSQPVDIDRLVDSVLDPVDFK